MTQTIREQLQALVEQWRHHQAIANANGFQGKVHYDDVADEIESILATPEPAVAVRKGWVCKDESGVYWHEQEPTWYTDICRWHEEYGCDYQYAWCVITDPWPDKPNGGPECLREVR